jgi:hypothetical protein
MGALPGLACQLKEIELLPKALPLSPEGAKVAVVTTVSTESPEVPPAVVAETT